MERQSERALNYLKKQENKKRRIGGYKRSGYYVINTQAPETRTFLPTDYVDPIPQLTFTGSNNIGLITKFREIYIPEDRNKLKHRMVTDGRMNQGLPEFVRRYGYDVLFESDSF